MLKIGGTDQKVAPSIAKIIAICRVSRMKPTCFWVLDI